MKFEAVVDAYHTYNCPAGKPQLTWSKERSKKVTNDPADRLSVMIPSERKQGSQKGHATTVFTTRQRQGHWATANMSTHSPFRQKQEADTSLIIISLALIMSLVILCHIYI